MAKFQQKYATEKEDTTTPEHYLWVSVLTKAAHDALYSSDWRESRQAIEWFKRKSGNSAMHRALKNSRARGRRLSQRLSKDL